MTQYEQLRELLNWLAYSYHMNAGTLEPKDLTDLLVNGDYGYNMTEEDFEQVRSEFDFVALAEFWEEGNNWSFSNLAGLFE